MSRPGRRLFAEYSMSTADKDTSRQPSCGFLKIGVSEEELTRTALTLAAWTGSLICGLILHVSMTAYNTV